MAVTSTQEERPLRPEWSLGERMAKARSVAGLEQQDMAEKLGVSRGAVAQWETNRTQPRDFLATLNVWADITGVDIAWLLGVTVEEPFGPSDLLVSAAA